MAHYPAQPELIQSSLPDDLQWILLKVGRGLVWLPSG